MSRSPEIWLGDLLRAWRTLELQGLDQGTEVCSLLGLSLDLAHQPQQGANTPMLGSDVDTVSSLADLVGNGSTEVSPMDPSAGPQSRDSRAPLPSESTAPPRTEEHQTGDAPGLDVASSAGPAIEDHAEPDRPLPFEVHELPSDGTKAGLVPVRSPEELLPVPPAEAAPPKLSLFHPAWQRAIVSTSLATQGTDGSVDAGKLIELVVVGRSVATIPLRLVRTLRRGTQMLVDFADGMLPFTPDQQELERLVADVVGRGSVEVLRFAGSPLRGAGPRGRSTWKRYAPPAGGRPVLVLSDLGLSGPPVSRTPLEEWVRFADLVQEAGCPLIAFVPLPSSRWPPSLTTRMRIVTWDRSTSVRHVRQASLLA